MHQPYEQKATTVFAYSIRSEPICRNWPIFSNTPVTQSIIPKEFKLSKEFLINVSQYIDCKVDVSIRVARNDGCPNSWSVHRYRGVENWDHKQPCIAAHTNRTQCLFLVFENQRNDRRLSRRNAITDRRNALIESLRIPPELSHPMRFGLKHLEGRNGGGRLQWRGRAAKDESFRMMLQVVYDRFRCSYKSTAAGID